MEALNGSTGRGVRVPWDRLRAWIDAHDAFEREHSSPATLSQAELQAISVLIPFGDEEPHVDDRDHVSALMRMFSTLVVPFEVLGARVNC